MFLLAILKFDVKNRRWRISILRTLLAFVLAATPMMFGQNTNIAVGSTVLQPSVKRMGVNLGAKTFYDSGQTTKNLLNQNPGFEGQIWNSTIRCMSGTATSCTDEDQWAGWPAGFWNGATFQVFYGAAAGRTGVVSSSTAAANSQGPTFTFTVAGTAPAHGDYMIVHMTVPGNASNGWWTSTTGAGAIGDNLTDLPPNTLGKQTVSVVAPTTSDAAAISGYFDTTIGMTFLQLNGSYQVQFKAKGTGGSNQVNVSAFRQGVATYLTQTITLTNSWQSYTLPFTAAENGSATGLGGVTFSTVGGDSFYLDDASLTQVSTDVTNTSVFRGPVVNALKTLKPGIVRYWGGQLGETLDNLLTPMFGRQMSGYSPYTGTQSYYGLHDFLVLCQLTGAEPWFVVPVTFTQADDVNLIEYLSADSSTPYGAKRAALGETTPWTQVFSTIHLEFGNEAWNSGFKGGNIEYSEPYGQQAQTIFGLMRNYPTYVPSKFDLVLGGQAAWPGRNTDIQNNCNNNDSFDIAPYTMGTVDSFADNEALFGSSFAEPEAYISSSGTAEGLTPGMIFQDIQAIQSSSHPVPVSFYEINMGTLGGSISQAALNSYTPSLGAGLTVVDTMLLGLKDFGVINQNIFALTQYSFTRPDGESALLWGIVLDMGATNRVRPQFLAAQLANTAISNGASMLQTIHSGDDFTWDEPLTNTVALTGAHFLQSYAFAQGISRSLIVFNLSRTSSLPVTFSDVNAPSGTVQMQQLTSANPTDTNESANVVQIQPSTLNNFNPAAGLSLPPYSMTVLAWTGGQVLIPAPPPVLPGISSVTASVSGTSAKITWTTDVATTSLVSYGTTTAYGSTSPAAPPLVTSHAVTLTNLTPGSTYDYQVVSANSSGASSTSPNYTFSVPVPVIAAPLVGYVGYWAITSSGITVSWSTDQPATTQLAYGASPALGQLSPLDSTLLITHGTVITGLTAGTTYYFVAQSTNVAGVTGQSQVYSFTTLNNASGVQPVISAITASISGTMATINWTTDQPTSSLVNYGTTAAYGSSSPPAPALVQGHSVTLTNLTPGATYNYEVLSTNAAGATSTSTNYTYMVPSAATPSEPAPYVGYVGYWAISSSGITVSWSTDQPATTQLSYGTSPALGQFSPLDLATTVSHGAVLTGLTPGTTYYFVAQSTNAGGVTGQSQVYSFMTLGTVPGVQPVISAVSASVTGISAAITWTTDAATTSVVNYGTTTAYGSNSPATSALVTSHSVTLTNLTPGAAYNYEVVSMNAAGTSSTSTNYTYTMPAAATPPEPAPYVGYVGYWAISSTGITVSWSSDQPATTQLAYGVSTAMGQLSPLDSTMLISHGVVLTGLTPGTSYFFVAQSTNASGITGQSQVFSFTTHGTAPGVQP